MHCTCTFLIFITALLNVCNFISDKVILLKHLFSKALSSPSAASKRMQLQAYISLAASKIEVKFPSSFWQLLKTLIKICSFSNKQPIYIPTCGNPTCAKLSVNDVIIYQFALDCHFLFEPYLSTANADNVTISFFKVFLPNSNTICRSSRIFCLSIFFSSNCNCEWKNEWILVLNSISPLDRKVFWCFQWVEKGCTGDKWVNCSKWEF